ncbi:glycogen branching enzyme [Lacticaseibacillus saniviri JCM 17471 = DSM 24301]|uniref:1,4-alpha-glucan branching enzyme n=1 Tax=Lacticaseibacillus saniviri JCM 17471 = DSM 24301 TaxID=1293598 RepID=A0A0R2MQZ8_9LACO|nr:glycogen branching enzyme [Lacticaseibacillus saniviri JCM 17471 = DSM 24301]
MAVVGDFNHWQPVALTAVAQTGCFEGTLVAEAGQLYKYAVTGPDGQTRLKVDPFGFAFEKKPGDAAILTQLPTVTEPAIDQHDAAEQPMAIYEVHLGSFDRGPENRYLTYRELAERLIPYAVAQGYTYLELMPLTEHLLDASWGYQTFGYFAPTSRFGTPADFAYFVDAAHRAGLAVIMDWVPGHFIKNTDTLYQFDGTPTFEYQDAHRAENVRWGTWNFDLGKAQVQSFLISSAVFWLSQYQLDGLRVDAVSNMLYMNYDVGKEHDTNRDGGSENLEGIAFIHQLNQAVHTMLPERLMIAEESSAFPQITTSIETGGLGFDYKWNMGWMNDTLRFFAREPADRQAHLNELTFSFMYMYSEHYVLPLSHDEVVHGKKSLMHKMPGDRYNQFANLRTLYVWLMTHPGKKLLFMGSEWGQFLEWRDWSALEWRDLQDPLNAKMAHFTRTLNQLYQQRPSLWMQDVGPLGMVITQADSVTGLSYRRYDATGDYTIVVLNLTPDEQQHFLVPVPELGNYTLLLNTESIDFGGTWTTWPTQFAAVAKPVNDEKYSIDVTLPAMGALVFAPNRVTPRRRDHGN